MGLVFTPPQAFFHFRTLVSTEKGGEGEGEAERRVLDDSRTLGTGPFELLVGRKFKLEIWENMVKTMRIGEIAEFKCPFKVSCGVEKLMFYTMTCC